MHAAVFRQYAAAPARSNTEMRYLKVVGAQHAMERALTAMGYNGSNTL
jgi:hypothetical protein